MRPSNFPHMPVMAMALLFLTSCGGSEEKAKVDSLNADSTTTTTTSTAPAPKPQGPVNMMIARHRVNNYAKWQASYDAHNDMRITNGLHNYVIGRGVKDSNMLMVAVKVDDVAKAKAFSKDQSLKQAMQQGGVSGTPVFRFISVTFQDTSVSPSLTRSMVTFTVKDWETWRKSFEEGKPERMDNGLQDRAYGHDVDDDHKVMVVVSILDSAKANAYFNSDMLKERRKKGGVISEPERFIYRVEKRY